MGHAAVLAGLAMTVERHVLWTCCPCLHHRRYATQRTSRPPRLSKSSKYRLAPNRRTCNDFVICLRSFGRHVPFGSLFVDAVKLFRQHCLFWGRSVRKRLPREVNHLTRLYQWSGVILGFVDLRRFCSRLLLVWPSPMLVAATWTCFNMLPCTCF